MKARIHFNRRATDDRVWTIHTSRECILAKQVAVIGTCYTEYKPEKRDNPRASIVVDYKQLEAFPNGLVRLIT